MVNPIGGQISLFNLPPRCVLVLDLSSQKSAVWVRCKCFVLFILAAFAACEYLREDLRIFTVAWVVSEPAKLHLIENLWEGHNV